MVLSFAPRGFSPGSPVFSSPQKPTFFDQELWTTEPLCGCVTSKSLLMMILIMIIIMIMMMMMMIIIIIASLEFIRVIYSFIAVLKTHQPSLPTP